MSNLFQTPAINPYMWFNNYVKGWQAEYSPDSNFVTVIASSWTDSMITLGASLGNGGLKNWTPYMASGHPALPHLRKTFDEASFPTNRWPATEEIEADGTVRFVLKDGSEIYRTRALSVFRNDRSLCIVAPCIGRPICCVPL